MRNVRHVRDRVVPAPSICLAVLFSLLIVLLALRQAALADGLPPRFEAEKLVTSEDGFVSSAGSESLLLVMNYLGVYLPKGREQLSALRRVAGRLRLGVERVYDDQLAFARLAEPARDRETLIELAAKFREAAADTGLKIGLAYVSPQAGGVPQMSADEVIAGAGKQGDFAALVREMERRGFGLLTRNPYIDDQGVFVAKDPRLIDLMAAARAAVESGRAAYAYPNFIGLSWDTETLLNDTQFAEQWHLRNTGQGGGTVDADADLSLAWDFTQGAPGAIIAINELKGFDTGHPDLTPNLWANPGEIAGDGVDNDGNGWIDDTLGWDFQGCTAATSPGCGDNSPAALAGENHGTAVAGVAAARGGNALGVTGGCPRCSLMLLRTGTVAADFPKSLAFSYAQAEGAQVISNSWGSSNVYPNTTLAINNAAAAGVSVLFASGNTDGNNCVDPRVGNNASVMAISSASNQDRKVIWSSVGACIDVLAPSHRGYTAGDPYTGTLNVTTTDRQGAAGYNNTNTVANCPTAEDAPPPANARDYTACFGGTSSATPLTAGVVGLIETVNPTITRTQIQNLLQDTADRVEDGVGQYADVNGFSAPGGTPTHAYGRLNAFEAVRVAAPVEAGGRGGVDVFIRDNRLDWGNTGVPSNTLFDATRGFIPHWRSVDVKVDAPPYAATPTTHAAFEAFADEDPVESTTNRVYVRVRNRGPATAGSVTVKFHWAFAGTALPSLPADFWTAFPANSADTSIWHPEPAQTISNLAYSGASVAGAPADAARILSFDFNAPAVDPTAANPRHYCVMIVLDSPQDPVAETSLVVDAATPSNNNVTHRNLSLQDSSDGDSYLDSLFVRNPYRDDIRTMVLLDAPDGWKVETRGVPIGRPFRLKPGAEKRLAYVIHPPEPGAEAEVAFVQYDLSGKNPEVIGGFTLAFGPRKPGRRELKPATVKQLEALAPRLESGLKRLEAVLDRLEAKER